VFEGGNNDKSVPFLIAFDTNFDCLMACRNIFDCSFQFDDFLLFVFVLLLFIAFNFNLRGDDGDDPYCFLVL
jgi:hypothetical protein